MTQSLILVLCAALIPQGNDAYTQFGQGGPGQGGGRGGAGQARSQGPKPYAEVVTKDFQTLDGVFKVHRKEDKVLFEIPKDMTDRVFLWVTEVKKTPAGGFGGTSAGDLVVRWDRRGDKVLLRSVNYGIRAEKMGAIEAAVEAANVEPIIMSFDVDAYADNGAAVIDVTKLYTSDVSEFSIRSSIGAGPLDASRSFLDTVHVFPNNINVEATLTFRDGGAAGGGGGGFGRGRATGGPSNTAVAHYSMTILPEKPMMGRLLDSRVGFFSVGFQDYGTNEQRVADRQYITRYRLDKKDPNAAVSDPVKPIVYYIGREVPEKWRPYIKQGVEDWQESFEKAGFRKAIICKNAPTEQEDPSWSAEDARYSVIRWAPTPTENAMGPHVSDPRSGEIISAHIIVWHNILSLNTKWYFAQASPNDVRARKLPFPDQLMGQLVRYVVSHEVGHTLGLQHNFKASSSYPVKLLRDKASTDKYGTEASIMDYGRFNYVAQPGDNARLIPLIGPYDRFAIHWGYAPIPRALSPSQEKRTLDTWAAAQVSDPMLRFGGNPFGGTDPTEQSEDLSGDSTEATRLGILNLQRAINYVFPASTKLGEDYDDLQTLYDAVWQQFNTEVRHVTTVVGGVERIDWHALRGAAVYQPVSKERQKWAVTLLNESVFKTPTWLLPRRILEKLEPTFGLTKMAGSQRNVLNQLLNDGRMQRMLELQAANGAAAYSVQEMLDQIRGGIWSELNASKPTVDIYRRGLQRNAVAAFIGKIDSKGSEIRGIAIGELRTLLNMIRKAAPKAGDRATALHLDELRQQIEDALRPGRIVIDNAPAAPAAPNFPRRGVQDFTCTLFRG